MTHETAESKLYTFWNMQIPEHMMYEIKRYTERHQEPISFLRAIICNDLRRAVETADDINMHLIPVYVSYFYNETPASCWGSKEVMDAWLSQPLEAA